MQSFVSVISECMRSRMEKSIPMIIQRKKLHAYDKNNNSRKTACLTLILTMFKTMRDKNSQENIQSYFIFCLSSGFVSKVDFELNSATFSITVLQRSRERPIATDTLIGLQFPFSRFLKLT